jgi:V/A-type H+/Na+-transporting ATPase subunit A
LPTFGAGHARFRTGGCFARASLQQSALSDSDAFCSEAALVDAVLTVVDRCWALVDSGVPATALEELDFGPLVRAPARRVGLTTSKGVAATKRPC